MSKFTAVLSVLLLFMGTAFSQITTSEVAGPVVSANAMYYNHGSHVARTSDGKLFVVWADPDANGQIVYSQYDDAFQTWFPPVALSNNPAGGTASNTAIAADDNGNLFVVWQQRADASSNYAVMFSMYNGSTWSAPADLSGNTLKSEEPNVSVGSTGEVFVVWNTDSESDGAEWVLCTRSNDAGSTWSAAPDTLSSADGVIGGTSIETARVNLARGSNGKMVATWFESQVTDDIFMNQFDGTQWSGEMVVTDTVTTNNRYSWAVLDNSDNIHIVWRGRISGVYGLQIKQKAWGDQSWPSSFNTAVDTGFDATRPSIVIDANEYLYVAYQRAVPQDTIGIDEIALVGSKDGGVTWTDQITLSRPNHDAGYQGMDSRVTGDGIAMAWRESYFVNQNDPDSLSVIYGYVPLDAVLGLDDLQTQIPGEFSLAQNYPNPFNPSTNISFNILNAGEYELNIFNILGEKVRSLANRNYTVGEYTSVWDARNDAGNPVSSGVYFYRLSSDKQTLTRKMLLVR